MKAGKKLTALVLTGLMLISGCSASSDEKVISKTAKGYGGDVNVTVTFADGKITKVEVEGKDETVGVGSNAIDALPAKIVEANGTNVDVVAGATITSKAILSAVEQAIAEATGEMIEVGEVKMKPGTYTVKTNGFSLLKEMEVAVTVSETAIESIEVKDNAETYPFLEAAKEKMIPRIIESQSISVDTITGVTGSSTGIKLGVEAALKEALAAGGSEESAIANFEKEIKKSTETETIDVDVLVVGLGGSGTAAAMSAAEAQYAMNGNDPSKTSVLAIDKAGKYGGTSCITADTMGINAKGYQDTYNNGQDYVDAEAMKQNWNEFTKGDAKQDLLDLFFNESGETIDWLIDHGFDYGSVGPQRGFTDQDIYHVKFQYTGQGYGNWKKETGEMFDSIMKDYEELGGKYLLEVEATDLIYDETNHAVTGVKAVGYDGKQYTINAKSVIIGTGGFSKNYELQKEYLSNEYYPLKGEWLMYGMQQNDGKMISAALGIGAGTYNIGMPPMVHLQGAPITLRDYPVEVVGDESDVGFWSKLPRRNSLNDFPQALASFGSALQVNMEGKRFSNEAGTFQTWKSGPRYYTIWSEETFNDWKENGFTTSFNDDLTCQGGIDAGKPIPELFDIVDLCIDKGIAYKADTLEELAKVINVDPTVLTEEVKKYNDACAKGVDEEFGKDPSMLVAIPENGPYYAFVGASYIYSTVGGLDVDTNIQVLDTDGNTIDGFYAVGTDSLGVLFSEQREYVTYGGAAQGWAYTSGRLAGVHAAQAAAEKK